MLSEMIGTSGRHVSERPNILPLPAQLADRAGMLYGELARFVLRILGFRTRKARSKAGIKTVQGEETRFALQDKPSHTDSGGWDTVWTAGDQKPSP